MQDFLPKLFELPTEQRAPYSEADLSKKRLQLQHTTVLNKRYALAMQRLQNDTSLRLMDDGTLHLQSDASTNTGFGWMISTQINANMFFNSLHVLSDFSLCERKLIPWEELVFEIVMLLIDAVEHMQI